MKKLKKNKDWLKKIDGDLINRSIPKLSNAAEKINELLDQDLAALIRECNALKKAGDRKAFLAPYTELFTAVEKRGKPGKAYHPWDIVNGIIYPATQVIAGWLKHGHKYRAGELLPPATDEQLQELQNLFPKQSLPVCFVQSYKIYGGIATPNVKLWGTMSLAPIDTIIEQTKNRSAFLQAQAALPFGHDGAGNIWMTKLSSESKQPIRAFVYDVNHEEPNYVRSVDKRFCDIINKNHQLTR
ncbi:SMI1/KNR4 family protein [Aureispira anguillae]|uniref:SMI1/KNR4 family protein n=1 Tax=Aureispira anguillae TaxID=2864201 RepID=A0A915YK34_9BACT|nr:SMI1/KNR4 family protein [Aureispira anguillae]BDS14464.1 SMI1/KNR4 family protein [Aureispira anguillae]